MSSTTIETWPLTPGQLRQFCLDDNGTLGKMGCDPQKWQKLSSSGLIDKCTHALFQGRFDPDQFMSNLSILYSGKTSLSEEDLDWTKLTGEIAGLAAMDKDRFENAHARPRDCIGEKSIELHEVHGLRYHRQHFIELLDRTGNVREDTRINDEAVLPVVWKYAKQRHRADMLMPEFIIVPHFVHGGTRPGRYVPVIQFRQRKPPIVHLLPVMSQEDLDQHLQKECGYMNKGGVGLWVATARTPMHY